MEEWLDGDGHLFLDFSKLDDDNDDHVCLFVWFCCCCAQTALTLIFLPRTGCLVEQLAFLHTNWISLPNNSIFLPKIGFFY